MKDQKYKGYVRVIRALRRKEDNQAELERLRAENERLREALRRVIDTDHHRFYDGPPPEYVRVARAALNYVSSGGPDSAEEPTDETNL